MVNIWRDIIVGITGAAVVFQGYLSIMHYVRKKYDDEIERLKKATYLRSEDIEKMKQQQRSALAFQAAKAMEDPPVELETEGYDEPRSYTTLADRISSSHSEWD